MIKKFFFVFTILLVSSSIYFYDYVRFYAHILIYPDDFRTFQYALVKLEKQTAYCIRNQRQPLNLNLNSDFYGLSKSDAKTLITLSNIDLFDQCIADARNDLEHAMIINKMIHLKEFQILIKNDTDARLATFKNDHIDIYNQFIIDNHLSIDGGGLMCSQQ